MAAPGPIQCLLWFDCFAPVRGLRHGSHEFRVTVDHPLGVMDLVGWVTLEVCFGDQGMSEGMVPV